MIEKLAELNESIGFMHTIAVSGTVVWAFHMVAVCVLAIHFAAALTSGKARADDPAMTKKQKIKATVGVALIVAIFAGLTTADKIYYEPTVADLKARKAEVCKSAFEKFAEKRDAELAREALDAGCDGEELVVTALSRGDERTAQVARDLVAKAE